MRPPIVRHGMRQTCSACTDSLTRSLLLAGLVVVVCAGSPRAGLAQQRKTSYYGTLAIGTGSMGFSGLVSGTAQSRRAAGSLRIAGNFPPAGQPVASDLGLVVSYVARPRHAMLSLGAGVAAAFSGDSSRTYGTAFNSRTTVGLPLEAQGFWRPVSGFGLGVIAYGDLNAHRSFVGILLGLQVGSFD